MCIDRNSCKNRFAILATDTQDLMTNNSENCGSRSPYIPKVIPDGGFQIVLGKRLKKKTKDFIQESDARMEAFNVISDRKKMSQHCKNTRMCMYVLAGQKCPRPSGACMFAHSKEELVPPTCVFGDACRTIWCTENRCMCIHSHETKEEFHERIQTFKWGSTIRNI